MSELLQPRELPGEPIASDELGDAYRASLRRDAVHQARVVWWALAHDANLEPSTVERVGAVITRFAARHRALGRARLADIDRQDAVGFLWARTRRGHDPAIATVHLRRTALRLLARTLVQLGEPLADPTAGVGVPAKTRSQLRPTDDDELSLVRIAAAGKIRGRTLAMATVALAEATATTGEIATIRWHAWDGESGLLLPGAGRIRARTATLTGWGSAALEGLAGQQLGDPDDLIAYHGGAEPGSQPSQAAVVSRLSRLLHLAGLDSPDLRPASIRLWQPARALAAGVRIETVARQLGHNSLDVTAEVLTWQWQDLS
jgi:site-specific recombinase XerC